MIDDGLMWYGHGFAGDFRRMIDCIMERASNSTARLGYPKVQGKIRHREGKSRSLFPSSRSAICYSTVVQNTDAPFV